MRWLEFGWFGNGFIFESSKWGIYLAVIEDTLVGYFARAMGCSPQTHFILRFFRVDKGSQIEFPILPMKKLEHFKLTKEYAVFCPVGQASFAEVSELLSRAVLRCSKEKIKKLLVDSTGLLRFQPPELAEQYNLAARIASDAAFSVKVAHIASRAWIRSGDFGLQVARNRGLDAMNFDSASTALEWLLKSK